MKKLFKFYAFVLLIIVASTSVSANDIIGKSFLIPTKITNVPNDISSLSLSPIIVAAKDDAAQVASSLGANLGNDDVAQDNDLVSEEVVDDANEGDENQDLDCSKTPDHQDCIQNNENNEEETLDCSKTPDHQDCQEENKDDVNSSCDLSERNCDNSYSNNPEGFCLKYPSDARCLNGDNQEKDGDKTSYDCNGADKGSVLCMDNTSYSSYCRSNPKDANCSSSIYCSKITDDPSCTTVTKK
jgi:hypothetical protein